MVVMRQILLIFNLSYLPCSVQFVNKNYCHAKKRSFYDLLMPLFCTWMMYCEFGRSFNEHTERSETEHGSDVESQMSEVGKPLGTFTRKTYRHEVILFRKRNSCRFIHYKIR